MGPNEPSNSRSLPKLLALLGLTALNVLGLVPLFLIDYLLDVFVKALGLDRGVQDRVFAVLLWAIPVVPGLLLVASWAAFIAGRSRIAFALVPLPEMLSAFKRECS